MNYNLEERTIKFGADIILFIKKIPRNLINDVLISQITRSATSIGANYCEADCAESRKDFEHKIGICKKESKETRYWLKMILVSNSDFEENVKKFVEEATELNLIFSAIIRTSKSKKS